MKLILIRHGQSYRNLGEEVTDEMNLLTEVGKIQMEAVARYLNDEGIDMVFCSPTDRCQQSMEILLEGREEEIPIHFSRLIGPKMTTEIIGDLGKRTKQFLNDLEMECENGETVVVVSHQTPIRMMLTQLLKKDVVPENASVSVVEIEGEKVREKELNFLGHLE